jgi:aminoglycoside phosphotransferase (APT) family kinase protein
MSAQSVAGLTKIAEGREAEILAWERGVVLKLYRSQQWLRSREVERAAMTAARAAGGPAPAAIDVIDLEGRPGLLMERVEGDDILTAIGDRPWTIFRLGGEFGRAHAELHASKGPDAIEPVKERLARHLSESPRVPAELRDRAMSALRELPDGDRLLHGDYHPGNVVSTKAGPRVLDWPNAAAGDPAADIARALLTLRLGEPPPGQARLVMMLLQLGRRILIGRYRSSYRTVRAFDDAAVERWMLPVAVHRLTEGIDEERERLLRLIETLQG